MVHFVDREICKKNFNQNCRKNRSCFRAPILVDFASGCGQFIKEKISPEETNINWENYCPYGAIKSK